MALTPLSVRVVRSTRFVGVVALLSLSLASVSTSLAPTAAAAATPATCTAPVASTSLLGKDLGITIADPYCSGYNGKTYSPPTPSFLPLTASGGATLSKTYAGIADGSAYRMEVPLNWNGNLVLFAHGYAGTGTLVSVGNPTLRSYYIQHGFAWAASSYQANGYDVAQGVLDTHALIPLFSANTGLSPTAIYMSGLSMGGQITAVEVEQYPHTFVAAMPYCGVLGANNLFNYFLDANVAAAALTHTSISYPTSAAAGAAYAPTYDSTVKGELPALGTGFGNPSTPLQLTPTGQQWRDAVMQRTGGTRPGFAGAFAYWNAFGFPPLSDIPFLFGLYPGLTGGTIGEAAGNVATNVGTTYRFTNSTGPLSPAEAQLNASALRVASTEAGTHGINYWTSGPLKGTPEGIPAIQGDPGIPVLSLHGLGDLFVPFSMDQIYAQQMAANHQGNLFVSRAIREVGHCNYTQNELASGFADLVNWVHTGQRPEGDQILDPQVVDQPNFGCRFTDTAAGSHPLWAHYGGAACPPASPAPAPGYRTVTAGGEVLDFGAAQPHGSMAGSHLNKPIVGMAPTPDGQGYWLVASDGGVFSFGDAVFYGSTGGMTLNKPVVGMAATPDGKGYWLVASDGGVFTFGDATFYGSTGGTTLNQPVVGMAATEAGGGYWLVAADGGVFTFGTARFYGSLGGHPLNSPVTGIFPASEGQGYVLGAADGGVFTFGDAVFAGSAAGMPLSTPAVQTTPAQAPELGIN